MPLTYHRSVRQDVLTVLAYYDRVGGSDLGDAFFEEFMAFVAKAVEKPTRFHRVSGGLRRANPARFPYHFLYRTHGDTVRILVVRHNSRDPQHGAQRK